MFQREVNAILAGVAGRKRSHVETVYRRLREAGQISGTGLTGSGAPQAGVADTAIMVIALLSIEQPGEALEALNRARGLIADLAGVPRELVGTIGRILGELVERGSLAGIADLTLWVGRPWVQAGLELVFDDEQRTTVTVEFHHVDAWGPAADDASRRDELQARWGYTVGTGGNRWAEMRLAGFIQLADAIANRTRAEGPDPTVAELFAAYAKLPPGSAPMVFARARGAPPAPAKGARRARKPR